MRVSGDDPEARFRLLFNETRHDLLAYAIRRTNRPEDAADVVAETYLIAWRKLDSLPTGGEARLWLFGVARNVLLRRASREDALQALVDRLALELHDMRPTTEPADGQLPAKLRAALEALPEQQREALLLTAWEGLTPREVAAVTGAPVNLVRVRLHRARSRLKRELAEAKATPSSRASPTARDLAGSTAPRASHIRRGTVRLDDA
jgi:RNA polymerase sigma-70 factor (ECF subfamily)